MSNLTLPDQTIPGVAKATAHVALSMYGKAQVKVIDAKTRRVVKEYPEQRNLILNAGMDLIASSPIASCFTHAAIGSGTTPTSDNGGVTTASQSGTTVTLSGGAFTFTNTATDAGKMIKWTSGEEARILTVTDATHCVVAAAQTVAAATFVVWRTNQTGLTTELKRTSTYLTGSGNCGSTVVSNSFSHKRTYDFTAEVGSVTYNEVGFANTSTPGANLFSRILLGAGVSLTAGQAVRLIYTLTVSFTPNSATAITPSPISGWAGATGQVQIQLCNVSVINTSGTLIAGGVLEPHNSTAFGGFPCIVLTASSTTFNSFNTAGPVRTALIGDFSTSLLVNASYTALAFTRTRAYTFTVGQANFSNIRSIFMCDTNISQQVLAYIIDADQTKDNIHTLTITITTTWTRVLA